MARRHDGLFGSIANFQALNAAARRAVAGKRRKPGAAAFMANLERALLRLERELNDGSYRSGRYLELVVRDPKRRVVSAAPFRDRVVHHALVGVIGPLFDRGFIDQTYANRTGKGTHRGCLATREVITAPRIAASCAAAAGTTTQTTPVPPTATGTHRTTATTTSVSAWPAPAKA